MGYFYVDSVQDSMFRVLLTLMDSDDPKRSLAEIRSGCVTVTSSLQIHVASAPTP
jgi:hypothetical protein